MARLPGAWLFLLLGIAGRVRGKWVEGKINTKENWAFLARFCFLSLDGQFEYLIEYDRDMGTPNLLMYYDDETQWPAVYHTSKTCKEREAVLKVGQNQVVKLSHWYPDTEYSGCIVTKAKKELPASKSTSTTHKPILTTANPFLKPKVNKNSTKLDQPLDPLYYEQFLKTTTAKPNSTTAPTNPTTARTNSTTWYELFPTDDINNTTASPDDLWENIGLDTKESNFGHLKDVEILFDNHNNSGRKIKRSTFERYEQLHRGRLKREPNKNGHSALRKADNTEKLIVSCHNSRRFKSARERWWFIAISNCESSVGLDVRYKFLMTNGPDGDFWHEHFSADEFYVLPVLLAYTFAYVAVMIAVVVCSVELKSRHLLHSTYKLFLVSIVLQHCGVMMQTLAYIRYAANGVGNPSAVIIGQFLCGLSEMTFLLLLVLMAKGFTITRGRLKLSFTVKLTIFMCCYATTYIVLFIYETKAFDPGEVLYLYESPAGYGLIVLRVLAWCVFAYSTYFTVRKYPEKNLFYGPFFICGTLWFYSGPLFILTANSYIDKWVRESVVTAVLLFIAFAGHIMFLTLTLPVFANKNFPYHVRTTQIGVMEVTGSNGLNSFGHNAYQPSQGAAQTVIIPLTRRTEELIGNMYNQYMATAPPLSLGNETPKLNGAPKRIDSFRNRFVPQDSTETNVSDEIRPSIIRDNKEIFTVENQMSKFESSSTSSQKNNLTMPTPLISTHEYNENNNKDYTNTLQATDSTSLESFKNDKPVLPSNHDPPKMVGTSKEFENETGNKVKESRNELPIVTRPRRNLLEPIKKEESSVTSWSLAKGPNVVAMHRKPKSFDNNDAIDTNEAQDVKKVPSVRNGLPSSGEISTIHEDHVQTYQNTVSKATIDLFGVASNKG